MSQTLIGLRRLTSLTNLKQARLRGQIATLLILIIAALLIFTLVIANIGRVSTYATALYNAADSASLFLASQLGTQAYQISEALSRSCGNVRECCKSGGWLSIVLAIVLAVVAIVIAVYCPPAGAAFWGTTAGMVTAGAIGGAVGGGIGGSIQGSGWLQGALQGAFIGASIGYGAGTGVEAGASTASQTGTATIAAEGFASVAEISALTGYSSAVAVGAVAGATLAVSSIVYNAYVADMRTGDVMAAIVRRLNGLPNIDRMRESAFYQALSQTVDDPTKVVDRQDCDEDDDRDEIVLSFDVWWARRIRILRAGLNINVDAAAALINNFFNGPYTRFQQASLDFLEEVEYLRNCITDAYGNRICPGGNIIAQMFMVLENAGYDVPFWEPNDPNRWANYNRQKQDYIDCMVNDDIDCPLPGPRPPGYDETDYIIDYLDFFQMDMLRLRKSTMMQLVANWQTWVTALYDPDSDPPQAAACSPGTCYTDSYYNMFAGLINGDNSTTPALIGIRAWIDELERIRQRLPVCNYGCGIYDAYGNLIQCNPPPPTCSDCILSSAGPPPNPPCRWHPNNPNFGTIDQDMVDEFVQVADAINTFISEINLFRQAMKQFYSDMKAAIEGNPDYAVLASIGGLNPVTYNWTDSRGDHWVSVRVSNFRMPQTRNVSSGSWLIKETCVQLAYGEQTVSVSITRQDPTQGTGILGAWRGGRINRVSRARYTGYVGTDPSVAVRIIP